MIAMQTITDGVALKDWLTMGGFVVMITTYIVNSRNAAKVLGGRLEMIDATMEDFKNEMKELQKVIIAQALQDQRLNTMDQRLVQEGRRVDRVENKVFGINGVGK